MMVRTSRSIIGPILAFLLLIAVVAVACTPAASGPQPASAPSAPAQVYKWKMQVLLAPEHPITKTVIPRWINEVKRASGGRIQVELFQAAALAPTMDTFKAVSDGVVDLACSGASYNVGFIPVSEMTLGWPQTFQKMEEFQYFLYHTDYLNIVRKAYAERGVYFLGPDVPLLYGPLLTRGPVNSLKDLQGLKIRAVGVLGEMMKDLGANPVMTPMQEIYTASSQGVIDGSIPGGISTVASYKLYEVAKYALWPPFQTWAIIDWDINLKLWNSLPDDLKAIVEDTQRAAVGYGGPLTYASDMDSLNDMVSKKGLKLASLPAGDVDKLRQMAMAKLDLRASKDAYSAQMVKAYKDTLQKFGYLK